MVVKFTSVIGSMDNIVSEVSTDTNPKLICRSEIEPVVSTKSGVYTTSSWNSDEEITTLTELPIGIVSTSMSTEVIPK